MQLFIVCCWLLPITLDSAQWGEATRLGMGSVPPAEVKT